MQSRGRCDSVVAMNAVVTDLFISYVKSFRLSSVQGVEVDQTGLVDNKRFVVVDEDGKYLSPERYPKMVAIPQALDGDWLEIGSGSYPHYLSQIPRSVVAGEMVISIRGFEYKVHHLGNEYAKVVSELLNTDCLLAEIIEPHQRRYGPIMGVDSSPIHIISEGSLDLLNSILGRGATASILRFRPSIVVSGCDPHDEDRWRKIRIGNVTITFRKLTERCGVVSANPETGNKDGNFILDRLGDYRKGYHLDGGDGTLDRNKIYFGSYWFAPEEPGTIKVGDEVEVLE